MNLKTTFLIIVGLFWQIYTSAQRTYDIPFRVTLPTIDGLVEEDSLRDLPVFDQFTTTLPTAGKTPQSPTKAWMIHTPEGIYVAAICSSNNLRNEGSLRDQTGTGDNLTLGFDTWNDDQNAFEFTVNAFGQRVEQRATSTATEVNFNTHWRVRTARRADGWTAEFFIPFTALRFSKQNTNWGVQITRRDPGTGEISNWNPTDPLVRDRVLQYGTLENLVIGRTKQRLGVAVLAQAAGSDQESIKDTPVNAAMDGKIGIGTASTLDFSFFTERTLANKDFSYLLSNFSKVQQPSFRQFFTEEPGLFQKTNLSDQLLYMDDRIFLPYFISPAGFIQENSRSLNHVRLTSRLNNGIGLGISNLLLSRPTAFVEFSRVKYLQQPFVNNISVEKVLRNNSWVQVSNQFCFLGAKEINQNFTSMATQLRDKTNRFQISGQLNTKMQNSHTIADGRISFQKINGIFQYGITHNSPKKINPNFIGVSIPQLESNTTGYFNWNNFSGEQKYWLNSTRYARFGDTYNDVFENYAVYYLTIGHRGLNKRFQEIDVSFSTNPTGQKQGLVFTDATYISKRLYWPLAADFSFTTDARRRATVQVAARLSNIARQERGQHEIKVAGRWVAHQKLALSLEQIMGYTHRSITTINTRVVPDRLAEQNNQVIYSTVASVQYTPSRVLTFNVMLQNRWLSLRQRQLLAYENKQFNNYDYDFIHNPANSSYSVFSINGDINFNSASFLRFSYASQKIDIFQNTFPVAAIVPEIKRRYSRRIFYASLIWNLNRI